ncbi:hypothetical protein N665_0655s0004 [Sinapis alba]|nr:hypothetical protein N665_0655s0004 [Sinapis alba]
MIHLSIQNPWIMKNICRSSTPQRLIGGEEQDDPLKDREGNKDRTYYERTDSEISYEREPECVEEKLEAHDQGHYPHTPPIDNHDYSLGYETEHEGDREEYPEGKSEAAQEEDTQEGYETEHDEDPERDYEAVPEEEANQASEAAKVYGDESTRGDSDEEESQLEDTGSQCENEDRGESYVEERPWCEIPYSDHEEGHQEETDSQLILEDSEAYSRDEHEHQEDFPKEKEVVSEAGRDDIELGYIKFSGHDQGQEAYLFWEKTWNIDLFQIRFLKKRKLLLLKKL